MKNSTIGLYSEILAEYEKLLPSNKAIEAYKILSGKYYLSTFTIRNSIRKMRRYRKMQVEGQNAS
jgi:hypothetical protein